MTLSKRLLTAPRLAGHRNLIVRDVRVVTLLAVCSAAAGCRQKPRPVEKELPPIQMPAGAEMIFWEEQCWEAGGGKSRLTIWADGRSEIRVVPDSVLRRKPKTLRPRQGWTMKKDARGPYLVRQDVYPTEVAKDKFERAWTAGISVLEPFRADYCDGGGTLVGVQVNGELEQTTIPEFPKSQVGSVNHRRVVAVAEVLADFDGHAYDVQR